MFRGLPTASLPVGKLFANPYLFAVPGCQRPYSWTTKEGGQLLGDLAEACGFDGDGESAPDYFLGTIILLDPEADEAPPPASAGPRVYEVVDGQQRLVTISILAGVLRDFEDNDAGEPGDEPSLADRLHAMVAITPGTRDLTTWPGRIELRNEDKRFLEQHVYTRGNKPEQPADGPASPACSVEAVHALFQSELGSVSRAERKRLAAYLIDYCHVVVIISRDIDRAHRLFTVLNERGKPLDRNDIVKAEVLRGLSGAAASPIVEKWEAAQQMVGAEFETFLGALRLTFGLHRLPIIAGVRQVVRTYGSERFVDEVLVPNARASLAIRTFAGGPQAVAYPGLAGSLGALNRLGRSDWVPAALLAMARFESEPEAAVVLVGEIERFAYLLRLLCYGAGKRERRFAPVIDAIRNRAGDVELARAFDISKDEMRTIAFHLKDLHKRNAAMARLVLMRIEDVVAGTPLAADPRVYTVEHVLPSRPAVTSEWRRLYPEAEKRAECQASLGNLALFTDRQNERAKNRDFADKLAIYKEPQPGLMPLLTNAAILESETWQVGDIEAREARFLEIIGQLWRLDSGGAAPAVRMSG